MITEDYVSFEVAKLLKEKGFDEFCLTSYNNFLSNHKVEESKVSEWGKANQIYRPTQQMAMKWLREVYKILIVISPHDGKGYSAILYDIIDFVSYDDFRYIKETDCFFNPEEAVEAALKYSLENPL